MSKPVLMIDNIHAYSFENYVLAASPLTRASVLEQLGSSRSEKVRAAVAENESTPYTTLDGLSRDGCSDVRKAVAVNPRVPEVVLWRLASDANPDVRYEIAENPDSSSALLLRLALDDNPYVAARAQKTLKIQARYKDDDGGSSVDSLAIA